MISRRSLVICEINAIKIDVKSERVIIKKIHLELNFWRICLFYEKDSLCC